MTIAAVWGIIRLVFIPLAFTVLAWRTEKLVSTTGDTVNQSLRDPIFVVAVLGVLLAVLGVRVK